MSPARANIDGAAPFLRTAETAVGKQLGAQLYLHIAALDHAPPAMQEAVERGSELAELSSGTFNVVRFDEAAGTIAFLNYRDFFESPFPVLVESWKVRLATGSVTYRTYVESINPPILHRKELLLPSDDPRRTQFAALTTELEGLGFFDDPVRIGFRLQWERLLSDRGFRVFGHTVTPIGNVEEQDSPQTVEAELGPTDVARHLTALTRHTLSAPVQLLYRCGFLDGASSVFDYGCGKGSDVRGLTDLKVRATGWDPYFAPDAPISPADIVNLGFVINVIEDPVERRTALQRAYDLAKQLLVVSVMIASDHSVQGTPYADGIITRRRTFQKYFSQAELLTYVERTLEDAPIPVAPGICFLFRDKDAEQRFQLARYRTRIRLPVPRLSFERPPSPPRGIRVRAARPTAYEQHRELLDSLWQRCLELGREPHPDEVDQFDQIEQALGSLRRGLRVLSAHYDGAAFEQSNKQRSNDLLVYLALQQFQRRPPYKKLDLRLQRDVRAFFRDYGAATRQARDLLSSAANTELLSQACREAAEYGCGYLVPDKSLEVHGSLVGRLPPILRVYVGCAGVLFGDIEGADLVKIHIPSGKVTFSTYDNFFDTPLPQMMRRVKINLRSQEMQVFEYGEEYPSPFLYLKSRFINEECPSYAEQVAFDEQLQGLNLVDLSGFGPKPEDFFKTLRRARWKIRGWALERDDSPPGLDDRCGRYLTFRQLIECGETQAKFQIPNLPEVAASYAALQDLATHILDPLIEYYGSIELTYGFCSKTLARKIPGRIAPELDQHAAHEQRRDGQPVCPRAGAAADLLVRDENMREVAEWIIANLPFDRLYFYGEDRPIHVSYGPDNKREAIEMRLQASGRRTPRSFRAG